MKKLLIFLILTDIFFTANPQKWSQTIGYPNRLDSPKDLVEYYDNGYFIVSSYKYYNQLAKNWEIKTDINANVLWDKTLIDPPELIIIKATKDNEGNTYMCGRTTVNSLSCPLLAKLDPCGQIEWCKMYYDTYFTIEATAVDILINEVDEIILLVFVQGADQINQIFLFGYSINGEYLWKQPYASKNNYPLIGAAAPYDLTVIHNKEYIISGFCYWPYPDDPNHVWLRHFFIGIDSLYNEKWILPFAALDSIYGIAFSAIPLNDSVIMAVGDRILSDNGVKANLLFFDINGNELGYRLLPNESFGQNVEETDIRKIVKVNDTLFISPYYMENVNEEKIIGDILYDTSGTIYNCVPRGSTTAIASIIKTFDNNYLIATGTEDGYLRDIYLYKINQDLEMVPFDTNQYTYDSLCPEPIPSGTINLGDCDLITDIDEIPTPKEYYESIKKLPVTAYPNPASSSITLAFQNTDHHTNMLLECFNIYGQRVHTEKIWKGQQETKIDLHTWSKGLYFAVVKSDGKIAGQTRFIINSP